MSRLANWQTNLSSLIELRRHQLFHFPSHNCGLWALEAIEAITGNNHIELYKNKFKTEKGAAKLLRQVDKVSSTQEMLQKVLGCEPQPIAFARMGDIVIANETTALGLPGDMILFGHVPGVCYGSISFFVGEFGLVQIDTLQLGNTLWVS